MKLSNVSKETAKKVYSRTILMVVSMILLVLALVLFTTAWYTKMVSTSGISLNAAQWDFTANYTIDSVTVNVNEYDSLTQDHAAPGTSGWIPIKLGATQSNTDVQFYLSVDRSTMSDEFKSRIFFYFYEDAATKTGKKYLGAAPEGVPAEDIEQQMIGTITKGGHSDIKIYWEWIYEAPDGSTYEEALAWDEFDTEVGRDPALYSRDMNATVNIAGVQVMPKE